MKRLLSVTAVCVAVIVGSASLSACDASPFAATINGQVIKQSALDSELHAWANAPGYVSEFDNGNSASNGGVGVTVAGVSPGATYNAVWVANQLDQMIEASAVHQYLAAKGELPDPAAVAAARSVSEIAESSFWYQLSPAFRQTLVQRLAEQAAVTPVTTQSGTIEQIYKQYQADFFTQVCVLQAATFNSAQAQGLVASGDVTGPPVCYTQVEFEQQPQSYRQAVLGLTVGSAPVSIQTSYGFQVVKLATRVQQPLSPELNAVVSTVVSEATSGLATQVTQLVRQARVQVDPAYGMWENGQVVPPTPPPQPSQSAS